MPDCSHKIVKYVVDTVEVSFVSEKKSLKFERNKRKFIGYSGCLRKEFLSRNHYISAKPCFSLSRGP